MPSAITAFSDWFYARPPFRGYWKSEPAWSRAKLQKATSKAGALSNPIGERDMKKGERKEGMRDRRTGEYFPELAERAVHARGPY